MLRIACSYLMLLFFSAGSLAAENAAPVKRIVALAPHITELLFAAGAGAQVVGTVAYSDYPEEAKKIPRVGDYRSLQLENVLRLKPDLIIAWPGNALTAQLEKLEKLGLRIEYSDPKTPQEIADTIRRFGQLSGHTEIAEQNAAQFLNAWQALEKRYASRAPVRVFYQVWSEPLMSLNKHNMIDFGIRACGGQNIFADAPVVVPQVSVESVLRLNPQVIISAGETADAKSMLPWRQWPSLAANQLGQFYVISGDDISRPVPGILVGVEKLCTYLDQAREKISATNSR